jgi:AraC family transcriptional regulator of adaptative response/methylated-DNA-[protein]-cysteine methyltransferase
MKTSTTLYQQPLTDDQCWQAVCARDASHDGQFVFAVRTTGIFCRPSCRSRRPLRENVVFTRMPTPRRLPGFALQTLPA